MLERTCQLVASEMPTTEMRTPRDRGPPRGGGRLELATATHGTYESKASRRRVSRDGSTINLTLTTGFYKSYLSPSRGWPSSSRQTASTSFVSVSPWNRPYIGALELDKTEVGHEADFLDATEALEVILNIGFSSICTLVTSLQPIRTSGQPSHVDGARHCGWMAIDGQRCVIHRVICAGRGLVVCVGHQKGR